MRVEAMKERIDELMEARQKLWIAACEADGIDPAASFVVFSEGNQAAQEHNELVQEILDLIEKRNRAIQAQAAKALKAARARDRALGQGRPGPPGRRPGARANHDGRGLRPQAERRVTP